jgi:hypothetical protein
MRDRGRGRRGRRGAKIPDGSVFACGSPLEDVFVYLWKIYSYLEWKSGEKRVSGEEKR